MRYWGNFAAAFVVAWALLAISVAIGYGLAWLAFKFGLAVGAIALGSLLAALVGFGFASDQQEKESA